MVIDFVGENMMLSFFVSLFFWGVGGGVLFFRGGGVASLVRLCTKYDDIFPCKVYNL
jgi:hypothetical protein